MAAPSLLSDVLRGDPEREPEDFKPPQSAFAPPGRMKEPPALTWKPGMLFRSVALWSVAPARIISAATRSMSASVQIKH